MNKRQSSKGERFVIGKVNGFHALQGALKVRTDTNNPSLLLAIETVEIEPVKGDAIRATVSSIRLDRSGLILTLEEYSDRTAAEPLLGATLYTDRCQVGALEEDEWWVRDLIGLAVYTTGGEHIGVVSDVIVGANQLLEVRKKDGAQSDTVLIPFVKALVPVVDMKAKRIEVENLPGLLD